MYSSTNEDNREKNGGDRKQNVIKVVGTYEMLLGMPTLLFPCLDCLRNTLSF